MAKMIKVTLTKSVIGASPKQRKVVEALGLKKMHQGPLLIHAVSYQSNLLSYNSSTVKRCGTLLIAPLVCGQSTSSTD